MPKQSEEDRAVTMGKLIVMFCAAGILHAGVHRTAEAGDSSQPNTTDRVVQDTKDAVKATKQYTLQQKEAFEKTIRVELNELQTKIAELQKKAGVASDEARKGMQEAIRDLEKKKNEARKKVEEMNESTGSAWGTLKEGMTAAVEDLKKSYQEAVSKLP